MDCVVVTDVGVETDDVFIVCARNVPARAVVGADAAGVVVPPPSCGARSDAAPNAAVVAVMIAVVIKSVLDFIFFPYLRTG
jgi:hypothetical protein